MNESTDTPVSFAAFLAQLAFAQQGAFKELPSLDTYGPDAWYLTFTRIVPAMDRAVFDQLWPLYIDWKLAQP